MSFQDLHQLNQLRMDLWKWPIARAALMVGAGFSANAKPKPSASTTFPSWTQLTAKMFYALHPLASSKSDKEILEKEFLSSNSLRIASEYEAAFGTVKLEQLIRSAVPDEHFVPGALHQQLMALPWADVFTTNYDTLLERTRVIGRSYSTVSKPSQLTTAFAPRIVKLHGCFNSNTKLIITEEHFRRYPLEFAPFVNTVRQSLLENSFALVGFSGEDPNFLEWLGWIRDELDAKHNPIYLVGALNVGVAERKLLDRRGVTPIDFFPFVQNFERRHTEVLKLFLEYLTKARPPRPEEWPTYF